jgi:hypothetical protein
VYKLIAGIGRAAMTPHVHNDELEMCGQIGKIRLPEKRRACKVMDQEKRRTFSMHLIVHLKPIDSRNMALGRQL